MRSLLFALPALLALALASPGVAVDAHATCAAATAVLGAGAPERVDVYMDPTGKFPLTLLTELRRLAADRAGEVEIAVHLVPTPSTINPRADRVRVWVASMAAAGKLFDALRVIRRDGTDRVYTRLLTQADRVDLAVEVGLDGAAAERWTDTPCDRSGIQGHDADLRARMIERGVGVFRLPMVFVGDGAIEDSGALEKLRPALGVLSSKRQKAALRRRPPTPPVRGVSERLRRPALDGAALGGIGLPHRFVVMARDEDDPNLFMLLPPVLRHRRQAPGTLTVQVVARGPSWGAATLRTRLCAARHRGLVAAYVRWLSTDPGTRALDPATRDLLEALDDVPEQRCVHEADPAELGLPDGGWLDGLPRTRSELEMISSTIRLLEANRRPLGAVLSAGARKDPS